MFLGWEPDIALDAYPFVVIGAGPAGLYLAQQLSRRGKVLVVEAGGVDDATDAGDDLYRLVPTGNYYPEIGTRLLAFGGTSNHWGGHSRPFSREIFGDRRGMPAWPIGYDDLSPFMDDARNFLRLEPFDPAAEPVSLQSGLFGGYDHLEATQFRYSAPVLRLGDDESVARMSAHPDIHVLTDTRLADIDLDTGTSRVETLSLRHRPSGQSIRISATQVFVCTGGIENARILLWAGRKYVRGNPLLGGRNELAGRDFTEKPNFWPVELFVDSRADFSGAVVGPGHPADLCWELSREFRAQHALPRFGVFPGASTAVAADDPVIEVSSSVFATRSPGYVRLDPTFQFEQTPHEGSYVTLADAVDADGIARPELHWTISKADTDAYRQATLMFCSILSQKGFVRARLKPEFQVEDWSGAFIAGCNHHIGTTRMAASPQYGVVDANCKVFGLDNLYVAGSSVFPSGDYVNPTLNLVALAGRLAGHVLTRQA